MGDIVISLSTLISIFHFMYSFHSMFQVGVCENWKGLDRENVNKEKEQLNGLELYLDCLDVLF